MPSSGVAASSLADLPLEILRRIVELGPCESALSLRGVSHAFRGICDDPLVYVAIIENGNGFDTIPTFVDSEEPATALQSPRSLKWWNNVRKNAVGDVRAASRWALADSRILCWVQQLSTVAVQTKPTMAVSDSDTQHTPAPPVTKLWNALKWFPELVSVGHPSTAMVVGPSESGRKALLQLARASEDASLQWQACFLCAAHYLPAWASTTQLGRAFNAVSPSWTVTTVSGGLDYPLSTSHQRSALLALHGFRHRVSVGPDIRNIRPRDRPPPRHLVPFLPAIRLPSPFPPGYEVVTAHLDTMVSAPFLEDDEWVGYYNYGTALNGPGAADLIMSEVRFQVETGDSEVTVSAPTGHDMRLGPFTLTGSIRQGDGYVEMNNRYASGIESRWNASMTPYGIVGSWGNSGAQPLVARGRLWLWKRSWVAIGGAD